MKPSGVPLVSYWKYIVFVPSVCERITPSFVLKYVVTPFTVLLVLIPSSS